MSQSPLPSSGRVRSGTTKLNIRLSTPKPPKRFLTPSVKLPLPVTPSVFIPLPHLPITPIESLAPPPPSFSHTQPLHSTPQEVHDLDCIQEGEDTSLRSDEKNVLSENKEDSSDDSDFSLPSPSYVPISKFVSTTKSPSLQIEADKQGKIVGKSTVESVFDISLDSLISDYPVCGNGLGFIESEAIEPWEPLVDGLHCGQVHSLPVVCLKLSTGGVEPPITNLVEDDRGAFTSTHVNRAAFILTGPDLSSRTLWSSSSKTGKAASQSQLERTCTNTSPNAATLTNSSPTVRTAAAWASSSPTNRAVGAWTYSSPTDRSAAWASSSPTTRGATWISSSPTDREADWSSSSPTASNNRLEQTSLMTTKPVKSGWSFSTETDRVGRDSSSQTHRTPPTGTIRNRTGWSSSSGTVRVDSPSSQLAIQLPDTGQVGRLKRSRGNDKFGLGCLEDKDSHSHRINLPAVNTPRTAWSLDSGLRHKPEPDSGFRAKGPGQFTPVPGQLRKVLGHSNPIPGHFSQVTEHSSQVLSHITSDPVTIPGPKLGQARSLFSPSSRSTSIQTTSQEISNRERVEELEHEDKLLSICYAGGNLGAALFNTYTGKLELLRDIPDLSPGYEMLTSLVYQVEPDIILVSVRQDQTMLECLARLCGVADSETSLSGSEDTSEKRISLVMRPGLEFGLASCTRRVKRIEVPGMPARCEQEQLVKLSAFVDFSCDSLVRAAGALLKYLDKNHRTGLDFDTPMVVFISSLVLDQILTMDQAAFTALQVFSSSTQLSGSRAGSWNKRREGLSMLNILNRCGSVIGSRFMRRMLRCPSANLEVINNRQQAISFFTSSGNAEFVQALSASIKQIKNYHRLMSKLVGSTMTVSDWQAMYCTLSGLVQLAQLGENCRQQVPVLKDIMLQVTDSVYSLRSVLEQVIDFQASLRSGNLSVKPGVDQELDEKRRLHNALPDLLNVVAQEESKNFPPYLNVCTVCYLPQVGYLIALPYKKELEEQGVDFRNIPHLDFVFESNGAMHYRNRRTLALDQTMGDVVLDITRLEMGILSRLTEAVLRNRNTMEVAVSLCGQLDCLLALAMVSTENNWTRPIMIEAGDLVIKDGRHPLQELSVTHFIPNSSWLGGEGGRVHLLTGPNSSGKSVYMKQVGLIVYLSHLGCWVPAQEARIPVVDRILTRIQTIESISLGMSSFLCDVNQLSTALTTSSSRSLLLVDEFGKGTAPCDGAALLAATILELLDLGTSSPLAILSSHFHQVTSLLGNHSALRYFQLETQSSSTGLVYMFKLARGVSLTSQAASVAIKAGVQKELVDRMDQVLKGLVDDQPISLQDNLLCLENFHKFVSCFLDVNLENPDEVDIFIAELKEMVM